MKNKNILLFAVLTLLIFIRYFTSRPVYRDGDFIKISGSVMGDPIVYEYSQYIRLADIGVYLPKYPQIFYGDKIIVEGAVDKGRIAKAKLVLLDEKDGPLFNYREKIVEFFQKTLPEPEAGLLSGILIGSKRSLDPVFYDTTKKAGLAHIVVASGTNVTFVAAFVFAVSCLYLPRGKSIYIVMVGIMLYLFIGGFDAPLVRAAIMAFTVFWGQSAGRVVSKWRIFFITIGIMLIYKPTWIFDLGFILSFAATAGLMLFVEPIQKRLRNWPAIIKESLSTSLAAQITVSPILYFVFGYISIWSIVTNIIVLWTIPIIMILGSVGAVVGVVFEPVGKALVYLAYPLLWWFCKVVEIFG